MVMVIALLLSVAPFSALADSHVASRTPVTFTSTVVAEIDPGEQSVDEAGIFHVRGLVDQEDISGDITGTAIVTVNVDFLAVGECTEESCPGYTEVWGTVEITDEAGRWEGYWIQSRSDVPGDEYAFSAIFLRGLGGNAGKTIYGEFTDETEGSVTIEGVLSTMAAPTRGLNLRTDLCFEEQAAVGNFLGEGLMEEFGHAEAQFYGSGSPWTHTYNLAGIVTLTDAYGSVTLAWVGGAQDNGLASHGFGNFMILDGTGAYAELYGHGRITGTALEMASCEFGYGARIYFYGEAHSN